MKETMTVPGVEAIVEVLSQAPTAGIAMPIEWRDALGWTVKFSQWKIET